MLKNHVLCHGKIAACVCVGVLTACTGSRESVLLQVHEAVVVVFEFFVVSVVQLSLILRSFCDELSLFSINLVVWAKHWQQCLGVLVECLNGEVHRSLVYFRALMLDFELSLVCWDCLVCLVDRFDYLLHL